MIDLLRVEQLHCVERPKNGASELLENILRSGEDTVHPLRRKPNGLYDPSFFPPSACSATKNRYGKYTLLVSTRTLSPGSIRSAYTS